MGNYYLIENVNLIKYNTLKIESTAKYFLFPNDVQGVKNIFNDYKSKKKIIIGNGSNILFSKSIYDDNYAFINFKLMDNITIENDNICCDAGSSLSRLSWFALENNISGYEFLEDIPGTLGGAIIMNAGTYNNTISDIIEEVEYYDIHEDKIKKIKNNKNVFSIRNSIFNDKNIVVTKAKMKIKAGDYIESLQELYEIKMNRYKKQPRNYPNAGSVFKKPKDKNGNLVEVWKLVEDVGLRGYCINDAMISDKHTGFIVNKGHASFNDIIELINIIKVKVKEKYDLNLELEWKII